MIATADDVRDARIYRVNAWRELKGRPALDFSPKVEAWLVFPEADPFRSVPDEAGEEVSEATPAPETRGPEWWTEANTAAWHREVWGDEGTWGEAQRGWGHKIEGAVGRAGASTYTPLKPELMAKWRASDPRPSNMTYYDGRPVTLKPLAVKVRKPRKAKVA